MVYTPERDIDESLMLYKGRLGWVQYIPLKRARFGVKTFLLVESKSGYIWSSMIYTGKGMIPDANHKDFPVSSQVVLSLIQRFLDKGYCLTTDNYDTSPKLADILISRYVLWNSSPCPVQKTGGRKTALEYRFPVIEKMVEKYHSPEMSPKQGRPGTSNNSLRLTERHFPDIVPATGKKSNLAGQCAV
ncbi:hypothetical protein J437_LFUL017946 [Ladona fulva]|uniref:PiggyBac transposable element-derived protein domain-containing protein n=1 Tax=Ladona fulva TaxID=123851 RepID=A0A8K0KPZ7_LADFU|nr:hypothetical protein J437_LFUL017946 [Ladona fulva]